MIQIRRNVFETNSSSTHSITMCMKGDYDLWVKDKVWFIDRYDAKFLPWDELIEYITKTHHVDIDDIETIKRDYANGYIERVEDLLADYDIFTYSSWMDKKHPDLERFTDEFTTPNGDIIKSFGYYGDDF